MTSEDVWMLNRSSNALYEDARRARLFADQAAELEARASLLADASAYEFAARKLREIAA